MFQMSDEAGPAMTRCCAFPPGDPRWSHIGDIADVSSFELEAIRLAVVGPATT
jgi:inorganic pyrophosphatase